MTDLITQDKDIKSLIYVIRGKQVMLDSDLVELYGYTVKRLNEQVKSNLVNFPDDFMFRLTDKELTYLWSQNATSNLKIPIIMEDAENYHTFSLNKAYQCYLPF